MLVLLLIAPSIQLLVLGFAVNYDVDRLPTVVCDLDRTAGSRSLVEGLLVDGTFAKSPVACEPGDPGRPIRDGRAKVVLVVPSGLARDLAAEVPVTAQVLVDGTDPVAGQFAGAAAATYFEQAGARRLRARIELRQGLEGRATHLPSLTGHARILFNPRMATAIFMVPGVSAMLLLIVTMVATAMGLTRERELGTLEQIMVTPIRPVELIAGKVLPFVVIGLFDVLLALVVGAYVFEVPIRGSLWVLAAGTFLYLMSTVGTGLFISTVSRSQYQAFLGGFFFMMPAILLSGVATPIANMPAWLQPITFLNPVRYFVEILRGVLLEGSSWGDLWGAFTGLVLIGTALLTAAVLRFEKRLG